MSVRTNRTCQTLAVLGTAALLLTACSGDDDDTETSDTSDSSDSSDTTESDGDPEQITLTVDVFGEQGFGYEALYEQYQQENPHITIEERGSGLGVGDYNDRLTQWITAGEGAGDVVALEEGIITQFYAQLDRFVDLTEYGAAELEGNYLPWKWEQGTQDGFILGLGTDVGSMAMCYRRDLFDEAGLPTDRDEVSALWPTWEEFTAVGQDFVAAGTDAYFLDGATNVYNSILMQEAGNNTGYTYYNTSNELDLDNPDIRTAWDLTVDMINADLSAGYQSFSEEWNAGFASASFATIACPAWMTGVIAGAAGEEASGQWDIADAPGDGGNWGGSFLAVPAESEHPEEAARLAQYLTSPDAHIEAFEQLGNLPSSPQALEDEGVLAATNEYFNDAPIGQIFAQGAQDLRPVHLGPQNNAIRTEYENSLRAIDQGELTPDEAWEQARNNASGIGGG
ncbi:ABC transporter substrate-binding protein [Phytoactinopolyspora halotolerans]|uniref:Extracellular solute-binding protein n=1 Tax=Phytoactinopolyspora halotolerans TaxID=1981512 RepID=A0A6L9SAR8_9ACTN|nr:extracellular solute-binding protein [Phytoactinopolyspora halotolerans]NEE02189.1 extracellular solute-binding protein [Phytoactinopolyspora halotolerans]